MRKFFRRTHKWLALPAGLVISIICLTGAILVFKQEMLEIANPSHYKVKEVKADLIPLETLIPMANSQLTDNEVAGAKISSDPQRTYEMSLANGFRVSAFVDPYTGKVMGEYHTKESIFWDVMILHRWLMDGSRTWGKSIVGISTILMALLLISGLVLWMPRRRKNLKKNLKINRKLGRKRLFYDLHNVLGAYASFILLVCSLTGLMWSFEWYRNGVFKIFGAEVVQSNNSKGKEQKEEPKTLNLAQWQTVFAKVANENPTYDYIRIQDGSASVHDKKALPSRQSDTYKFDSDTGEILNYKPYSEQSKVMQIWGWVYSFHVGDYFGFWSKILTCIASLIGASLPITGYYLYFKKLKKKKAKREKEIKSVSLSS